MIETMRPGVVPAVMAVRLHGRTKAIVEPPFVLPDIGIADRGGVCILDQLQKLPDRVDVSEAGGVGKVAEALRFLQGEAFRRRLDIEDGAAATFQML